MFQRARVDHRFFLERGRGWKPRGRSFGLHVIGRLRKRDWFPSKGDPKVMQRRGSDGGEGSERSQSVVSAATAPPVEYPVIITCFMPSISSPCVICYVHI